MTDWNSSALEFDIENIIKSNQQVELPKRKEFRPRQFLTIPNNPVGWVFLWYLRKRLNRKTYELRLHGRGQKWWVKFRDRVAMYHDKPIQDQLGLLYRESPTWVEHNDPIYIAFNARVDKMRSKLWGRMGRDRYGIRLKYAKRWGVYFNEKRSK